MKCANELEKSRIAVMLNTMEIHKKVVVDDAGMPQEVIIPWAEFQEIEEMLGLDLETEVGEQLKEARHARDSGESAAYVSLNDL